jgi:hypothetical protein
MSATVTTYDTVISRNAIALRLPHLRGSGATDPLLLRHSSRARHGENSQGSRTSRTIRA